MNGETLSRQRGTTDPRQDLRGRRGAVFSVRFTAAEREAVERAVAVGPGPRTLGAWIRHQTLAAAVGPGPDSTRPVDGVIPARAGITPAAVLPAPAAVVPGRPGMTDPDPPVSERVILDLCAGSGSWSAPYASSGYDVRKFTLPDSDVRVVPARVLPAREKRNPRDLVRGMEVVNACLRLILQVKPKWWALENPSGMLSRFLGTPRDVWNPCDFGDPWTKRTGIWGEYVIPARGPFVRPEGSGPLCRVCGPSKPPNLYCRNSDHRAVTPAGFARAFFEANP